MNQESMDHFYQGVREAVARRLVMYERKHFKEVDFGDHTEFMRIVSTAIERGELRKHIDNAIDEALKEHGYES